MERTGQALSFLDGTTWTGVTSLDKYVRQALAKETSVYTKANPVFFPGSQGTAEGLSG